MKGVIFVFLALAAALPVFSAPHELRVEAIGIRSNGWFELRIPQPTNSVYSVQRSTNLVSWVTVGVLHGPQEEGQLRLLPFVDTLPSNRSATESFYRVAAAPLTFESDWRNQVYYLNDPFRGEPVDFNSPETRWIKFAILTNEPGRVYYQNSFKYKFHYDFAQARLPGFKGLTTDQFDAISLRTNSQQIILGSVLFPPQPGLNQFGVQFVGRDAYDPEKVVQWLEAIRTTVLPLDSLKMLYLPTYEQIPSAEAHRSFFASHGIELGTVGLWDTDNSIYSFGWGLGTLKFFAASQINKAYANGDLLPSDILLTDGVPAEIPYVSGILTLSPSTPNSHVALLARSYGVPFVHLGSPSLQNLAQSLLGKDVIVSTYKNYPRSEIRILDITTVSPSFRQELATAKTPAPLQITPKARLGHYFGQTENLTPADLKFFGGKASSFGFLRREIPSNSPPALAISFDLWDEFLDQTLPGGSSLRQEISSRLSKFSYPPDMRALTIELKAIRDRIEDDTQFTWAQRLAIAEALLGQFNPQRKIRFRSSTNVEDTEEFIGAGLYDSYSGCLADDQDQDATGPSLCDSSDAKEKGVFRAIRKVYASFYNDNAFLERLRHRVDESKVGMAILVHYSNPDEEELANGVATVTFQSEPNRLAYTAKMVTQKGAVSVSNPDNSALPEVVSVSKFFDTPYFSLEQGSTLVPLGGNVLEWTSQYRTFANLFSAVGSRFNSYYPAKTNFILDFEYKMILPGQYLVKQVRELPRPKKMTEETFLINNPSEWCVFQGEFGSVFSNHRLKARFHLTTRNLTLTPTNLAQTLFGPITVQYPGNSDILSLSGVPDSFPNAVHSLAHSDPNETRLSDEWSLTNGALSPRVSLDMLIRSPEGDSSEQSPIVTLDGLELFWSGSYTKEVPTLSFGSEFNFITNETVRLVRCPDPASGVVPVTRTITLSSGVTFRISFFWPEPPSGFSAGYTAPLVAWKETVIEGLTDQPITLRGYYSQTYRPEHHNFSENFLFEPALEPGVPASVLAQLEAQGIRYLHAFWSGDVQSSYVNVADTNWKIRRLGQSLSTVNPGSDLP